MSWKIVGFDKNSGDHRIIYVDAPTRDAAFRQASSRGIIVDESASGEAAGETQKVASQPHTPSRTRTNRRSEPVESTLNEYKGLKAAAWWLTAYARFMYFCAILLAALSIVAFLSPKTFQSSDNVSGGFGTMLIGLSTALSILWLGIITHAIADGCLALREIALNSR